MIAAHKSLRITDPPDGSIYFDELIHRYLFAIGLREYRSLDHQDITQYALLAFLRVTRRHGLVGTDLESFWEHSGKSPKLSHVRLLPDTPESYEYYRQGHESAVILNGVQNVKALMKIVFLNLLNEEFKAASKQKTVSKELLNKSTISRRRHKGDTYQPLEAHAQHLNEQRDSAQIEAAKAIVEKVCATMNPVHQRAVLLLLEGFTAAEIADLIDMTTSNVYQIFNRFKKSCKEAWVKLSAEHNQAHVR